MDELSMPWGMLINPDMDAIKRRDETLLKAPDYIQNQDGGIVTKIDMIEVVRCKYCKWYGPKTSWCYNLNSPKEQTFYCADGKRW